MTDPLSIYYSRSELLDSSYAETIRICFSSFGRERIEAVLSRTLEDDDGNSPRKVLSGLNDLTTQTAELPLDTADVTIRVSRSGIKASTYSLKVYSSQTGSSV
jgi:hypothetical protein